MWIRTGEIDEPLEIGVYLHTQKHLRYVTVELDWPFKFYFYSGHAWSC